MGLKWAGLSPLVCVMDNSKNENLGPVSESAGFKYFLCFELRQTHLSVVAIFIGNMSNLPEIILQGKVYNRDATTLVAPLHLHWY